MATRMKEDEKNEKIIRGLLKLPANRRCINCNNLGPQYVCTNFWTFICTNCSGMHREFTHRVKSISMAKFTSQEVSALQEGGNERAKEIYFKDWDLHRNSFPDSSNIDRLRDFIKHVYVERRYTGERNVDKLSRMKSDGDDSSDYRKTDSHRVASRSPPFEDRYERRYDDRNSRYGYGERSPVHDSGNFRKSPRHFEGIDESRREEKTGNVNQNRRFEEQKIPDAIPKPSGWLPKYQKDITSSIPPVIRPVTDILGNDVSPLQIGDLHKSNGAKASESSPREQITTSSSSTVSSDGNAAELKRANLGSLIDFDADSGPLISVSSQQNVPQQPNSPPASGESWASFVVVPEQKTPQPSPSASSVQSALDQLSENVSTSPVIGIDVFPRNNDNGRQFPTVQHNQPAFLATTDCRPTNPPNTSLANSLKWEPSVSLSTHGTSTSSVGPPSQYAATSSQGTSFGVSQPAAETKPSERKKLPEDLFVSLYPSASISYPGWQRPPHLGMGYGSYGMQYPVGSAASTVPQFPKSSNPFDLVTEPSLAHASMFPSMASLQGALPNVTGDATLLHSASFSAPSLQWMPSRPSFSSVSSPRSHMLQQGLPDIPLQAPSASFPTPNQGISPFSGHGVAFGTSGLNCLPSNSYSQSGSPNSFAPVGGNPFG